MSVDVIGEIWTELKRYINVVDRADAAESIVSVLIDHDIDADEIRTWFKGDSDIKTALSDYLASDSESDEYEEEEEEYEEESDEEDWD
jgi:hypothetical protein